MHCPTKFRAGRETAKTLAQLKQCLSDTQADLRTALDQVDQARRDLAPGIPSADAQFALQTALRRESTTRRAYSDMLQIYHLAVAAIGQTR